jgi:hypothetical protein
MYKNSAVHKLLLALRVYFKFPLHAACGFCFLPTKVGNVISELESELVYGIKKFSEKEWIRLQRLCCSRMWLCELRGSSRPMCGGFYFMKWLILVLQQFNSILDESTFSSFVEVAVQKKRFSELEGYTVSYPRRQTLIWRSSLCIK